MEIDEAILKVATEYFDLVQDEKLQVVIANGIDYLVNSATQGRKFGAILFDVDSKDSSLGMSCPPKQFVELDFLNKVKNCLSEEGYLVLNLVARNTKLRDEVIIDLRKIFKFVVSYKVEDEVNEIVFCSKKEKDFQTWINSLKKSAETLNEQSKLKNPLSELMFEIPALLNNLKIQN